MELTLVKEFEWSRHMFDMVVSKFNQTSHAYTSHTWTQTHTRYASLSTTTSRPCGRFFQGQSRSPVVCAALGGSWGATWCLGDSYRRVLVLYFLNTSLYLFINHDVLPYSTNKLFILYNTMQFCHVASPKLGGLIRQKLNDHIFLGPLAPIYIDITRSGNSWSVCDIVLCDWDNNMVRIGFGTFGGFDLAFF